MEQPYDPDRTAQAWGGGISRPASVASYVSDVSHHSYAIPDPDAQSSPAMHVPYDPSSNVSPADICNLIRACQTEANGRMDKIERELAATTSWLRRLNREIATKDELAELKTHVDGIGAYAQAAYKDTQSLIGAIGKVESMLQSSSAPVTSQPSPTIPTRSSKAKTPITSTISVKTAKPDKFDGSKKDKATDFRVACTQHLRSTYPNASEDQQVMFVTSYLEGIAHDWLRPHLELDLSAPVTWLHDIDLFWEEFDKRFGEVNKKESYRGKLRKLSQTKLVQDYLRDFQTYSGPLRYDDTVLRDMFYDGLKDEIKSAMVAQLFDYDATTTTFAHVANRALEIDQRLEAFKSRTSTSSNPKPANPSTSSPSTVRFAINDYVYMTNTDGRAVKGQIKSIKKDVQGRAKPMVLWNGQKDQVSVPFSALKKDNSPSRTSPTFVPITPPSSRATTTTTTKTTSGPVPMDLDSANRSRPPFTCHNCGGKGHMARECPSKGLSGHEAKIEEIVSEEEESGKEDA